MDKLSDRIQIIIDALTERINEMEDTAVQCNSFINVINELYVLYNTVLRMEEQHPTNYEYFEKTGLIVLRLEKELYQLQKK